MTTCEACNISRLDNNWRQENLKAHTFPVEEWQEECLQLWLKFCNLPINTEYVTEKFICSRHFSPEDYFPGVDCRLKLDAIPHLCPPADCILPREKNIDWNDSEYEHYELMEENFGHHDQVFDNKQILENVKSTLCRLCGKAKSSLSPVYDFISSNEEKEEEEEDNSTVAVLIEAHLPLKISKYDVLPLHVCSECLNLLQQWHALYTTCQAADLALQKIFCQSKCLEEGFLERVVECESEKFIYRENFESDLIVDNYLTAAQEHEESSNEEGIDIIKGEDHIQQTHPMILLNAYAVPEKSLDMTKKIILYKKQKWKKKITNPVLQTNLSRSSSKDVREHAVKKQTFLCNYCHESFTTLFKKRQHLLECREMPSICEKCGEVVTRRKNMVLHQKKHKFELTCDRCGACCTSAASFQSHLVKVHNEEPKSVFCCQLCCRAYYSLNQYSAHIKIHNAGKIKQRFNYEGFHKVGGSPEYVCSLCESGFDDKISLIVHLNAPKKSKCNTCQEDFSNERGFVIHNGRKVFCQYCNKAFCVIQMMKAHERTHTKEKPFNCKVCSATFRTANQRDSHETIHSPPMFECSFCKKKFRYRAGFQDHLNYHLGNLVSCKLCNRKYGGNLSLLRHVRRYHNKPNTCSGRLEPIVSDNSKEKIHI